MYACHEIRHKTLRDSFLSADLYLIVALKRSKIFKWVF
jgi:hypothetical protein